MSSFLVRRLVRLAVVITGVSLVTFAILHASGDPVSLIMPEAPEADRAVLRRTLGLHDPLPVQFVRFVGNAVTGNFGKSFFHHGQSASALVLERMPTTLMLTVFSMGVALAIALPVGIYSAVRRGRAVDQLATGTVFLGQSMPVFWTGIMLILLFSVQWRLLPVSGWESWAAVILPTATLSTFTAPLLLRIVRSSMLDVIGLDYVRTARAKGVSEWLVICRHALKNAALPLVTVTGLQFGLLLGGAVITETVFAVPGVGRLIVGPIRRFTPPVWAPGGNAGYLLGTDQVGRDVLSRIIHGARISLLVGVLAVVISVLVGVTLGLISGFVGGRADTVIMTIVDITWSFPQILLALAFVAALGPSLVTVILVLGFTGWERYARVVRAEVLALREKDFIEAARAMGIGSARILVRHVLPNTFSSIVVLSTLQVAQAILQEAALSFLGVGSGRTYPTWGHMIALGRGFVSVAWCLPTFR